MKYRQRQEEVNGESPYVEVRLSGDGTEAHVKVMYSRNRVASDTTTTTFGTLNLGWLSLDDLACVARTMTKALAQAQERHFDYLDELMSGVKEQLP